MANLNESVVRKFPKRMSLAESLYKKSHNGETMDMNKKVMLATVLNNTTKFLSESLATTQVTQRADMDALKRFCTDVVNVSIPNLVGTELVKTFNMTSITGYKI